MPLEQKTQQEKKNYDFFSGKVNAKILSVEFSNEKGAFVICELEQIVKNDEYEPYRANGKVWVSSKQMTHEEVNIGNTLIATLKTGFKNNEPICSVWFDI